jgi:DNA-binding SARP family transcriptional activator
MPSPPNSAPPVTKALDPMERRKADPRPGPGHSLPDVASLPPDLTVLGTFELTTCGSPVSISGPSERMLAYLTVHGRAHPVKRTTLAAALWADSAPHLAAGKLRSLLWRLTRNTGKAVVTVAPNTVRLADRVSTDLWLAEDRARDVMAPKQAAGDPDPNTLAAAARTEAFCADLLPEWSDDWLVLEREAFRQKRLYALEAASALLLNSGSHHAALAAALAAVQCEPLRESAHRAVIAVHLADGNHAEALHQFQTYRRLLAAELGLAPTATIRALVAPLLGRPLDRRPSTTFPTQPKPAPQTTATP